MSDFIAGLLMLVIGIWSYAICSELRKISDGLRGIME